MKKFITLITVIIMLITSTISSNAVYFTDVSMYFDNEILNAINYMSDNGYMNGSGDGTFGIDISVTRSVFVTVLFRYSEETGTYTHPFSDVSSTAFYSNAVGWAYQKGISGGTGSNTFSPNATLTREQLVIMLKNYAVYKNNYETPADVNLNNYNDSSNIATYAVDSIKWGIYNNIIKPEESRIGPKDIVTRTILAVYLHRYSILIDSLNHETDVFSFNNSSYHFGNTYYVSDHDKDLIDQALCAYYGVNRIPSTQMTSIVNWYTRNWSGSCKGMALAVALDKLGILAFNENFDTNKSTMSAVSSPATKPSIKSIINVYQVTQELNILPYNTYYSANISNFKLGLFNFVNDLSENGIALFDYYTKDSNGTSGHALVAYDVKNLNTHDYIIKAYDCNTPTETVTININTNRGTCTIENENDTIFAIKYTCNFSMYNDYLDFDGIYNDNDPSFINNLPPVNSPTLNDTTTIKVYKYDDYEIESEDIGNIIVSNGTVSGDLEISNQDINVGSSTDSLCTDEYIVGTSNCYDVKYDENKAKCLFEIYHDEYNVIVESENTNRILVTTSSLPSLCRSVRIFSASNSNFSVLYKIDDSVYDFVKIEGISNGYSMIVFDNDDVSLSGISGSLTFTYIDYDTFEETTVTVPNTSSSTSVTYPTV